MVTTVVDAHYPAPVCVHCRLQAQLDAAAAKLERQSAAAAKAVAEECERHVVAERALQQQVQQLTSQLAVSQVCGGPAAAAHLDACHVHPYAVSHSNCAQCA